MQRLYEIKTNPIPQHFSRMTPTKKAKITNLSPMNMLGGPSMRWLGRITPNAPTTRAKRESLKPRSRNYLVFFNNTNCEVGRESATTLGGVRSE